MHKNTRNLLLTLTALSAVGLPLAGHALAQGKVTSGSVAQSRNRTDQDTETQDDQGGGVRGSIQLPAEAQGTEVPDNQEDAQYRSLAKVTPAQAEQAARAAVPGRVTSVRLENEDGSLVYVVVIDCTEVKVDAGNGRVLRQETADHEQESGQGAQQEDGEQQGENGNN